MKIVAVTIFLFTFELVNAFFSRSGHKDEISIKNETDIAKKSKKPVYVNGTRLDFLYWNSDLGNDHPISVGLNDENVITKYWIEGLPLKVITHGWLSSDSNSSGVFVIKTAYVDMGGFNVISVDWSSIADDILYPLPALLTVRVGKVIALFLDGLVDVDLVKPADIHLIGHSLGAHVVGACGSYFSKGKIGRITGLDPASPGFEVLPIQLSHLSEDDADFVDVIHTCGGSLGFSRKIGHADFYPNGGIAPQPGCGSVFRLLDYITCSHSRSHELYADSVYHRNSLLAVECSSLLDYTSDKCASNLETQMGHDAIPSSRGKFYLKTNMLSPFGILKKILDEID